MHSFLGGECPHGCKYCYVGTSPSGRPPRYCGNTRLIEAEFKYGYSFKTPQVVFIEHMQDLFAKDVSTECIERVLAHCNKWPKNTYVFQTKNPVRFFDFLDKLPLNAILGTTVESNIWYEAMGKAPLPFERIRAMINIPTRFKRFLTLEPIMRFDLNVLTRWVTDVNPDFINLGADSKDNGLVEPTVTEIMALVAELHKNGIELREKENLARLKP